MEPKVRQENPGEMDCRVLLVLKEIVVLLAETDKREKMDEMVREEGLAKMVVQEQMAVTVEKEVLVELEQKETEEHLDSLDNLEEWDNLVPPEKRDELLTAKMETREAVDAQDLLDYPDQRESEESLVLEVHPDLQE